MISGSRGGSRGGSSRGGGKSGRPNHSPKSHVEELSFISRGSERLLSTFARPGVLKV